MASPAPAPAAPKYHDPVALLEHLRVVHEEAHQPQPRSEEREALYQTLTTDSGVKAVRYLMRDETDERIIKQLGSLAVNPLFLAEAAARSRDETLVQSCCKKWGDEFIEEIGLNQEEQNPGSRGGGFVGFSLPGARRVAAESSGLDVDTLQRRVNKIESELTLPPFQSVETLRPVMATVKASQLATHIVLKKIPRTEANAQLLDGECSVLNSCVLMNASYSPAQTQLLIRRLGPEVQNLKLSALQKTLIDEQVGHVLTNCPNLKSLDLSECTKLSRACLTGGHQQLARLVLTGTNITADQIPYARFPALSQKQVENTRVVATVQLDQWMRELDGGDGGSWQDFANAIERATVIIPPQSRNFYDLARKLWEEFSHGPTATKFRTILALRQNFEKIEVVEGIWGLSLLPSDCLQEFDRALIPEVLQVWTDPEMWRKTPELGTAMTKWLVEMLPQFKNMGEPIRKLLWDVLLSHLHRTPQVYEYREWRRGRGINEPLFHSLLSQLVGYAEEISPLKLGGRPLLLEGLKGLLRGENTAILPHVIACALCLDGVDLSARKDLLSLVLATIRSGRVPAGSYPLAKLVVGCVTDLDLPKEERGSDFAARLAAYKGIFSERNDTSELDDQKRQFQEILYDGRIGRTPDVVEALLYFYKQVDESEHPRILQALQRLDGEPDVMQSLVRSERLTPEMTQLLSTFNLPNANRAIQSDQEEKRRKAQGAAPSYFSGLLKPKGAPPPYDSEKKL